MRPLALIISLILATSGCAALASDPPKRDRKPSEVPQCSSGRGGVVLDGTMAVLLGLVGVGAVANDAAGVGLLSILAGVAYAGSAAAGSSAAGRCETARTEYATWQAQHGSAREVEEVAAASAARLKAARAAAAAAARAMAAGEGAPVATPPTATGPASASHEPPPAQEDTVSPSRRADESWDDFWKEVTP